MAARHTRRSWSLEQRETNAYNREVRNFIKWCEEHDIKYHRYGEALFDDICVLSRSEFDIHDSKQIIFEDNESYFLSPKDYERWCEED